MRILQVMAGRSNGGAELYSTDVMLSLAEAGIDQCVALRHSAPRFNTLQRAGLRMAPEVYQSGVKIIQRFNLRRLIRRERPDISLCWMRRAASLGPSATAARAAVIGWFGDYEELKHFSHCSHLVGCTPDLQHYIQAHGFPAARSAYIPTFPSVGAEPALDRARLNTPGQAKLLLTLSRLHPTKGLDTLIKALTALPGCYLWIAGDGPMRASLENLAQQTGVAERVRFLGWRTDRGALLRAADICVLPSSYEPFGTVILDAWSTKTAFIACDSTGPRTHIRNGENGMLVPANDAAALAAAIETVTSSPELQQRIALTGYAEYQARFTREIVTRQWIDYYRTLLPSPPR
jgi:glycosyltransferase involved in cell wall biosynthesis